MFLLRCERGGLAGGCTTWMARGWFELCLGLCLLDGRLSWALVSVRVVCVTAGGGLRVLGACAVECGDAGARSARWWEGAEGRLEVGGCTWQAEDDGAGFTVLS